MTNDNRTARKTPMFFDRTFDETVDLLNEAQGYVAHGAANDRVMLSLLDSLRMTREIGRLTTRLCEVMAWLLVQKAVHAGELTADQAIKKKRRLASRKVCLGGASAEADVPARLEGLLDRSQRLYVRVSRLDDMSAKRCGAAPGKRTIH